jgi:hypothetical protein
MHSLFSRILGFAAEMPEDITMRHGKTAPQGLGASADIGYIF